MNVSTKIIIGVGVAGLLVAGYFIYKKAQKAANYQEYEEKFGSDGKGGLSVQFATSFYTAMNGWGTNEKSMYQIVESMKANKMPFADVAIAYRNLYDQDLLKTIQKELGTTEFTEFQKRMK